MKITVSFYHNNAILISEFTPTPYIDYDSLYALDFKAYSSNGNVLEHNSKFVPPEYVARRIKTCRKYHGTLSVTRNYRGICKITYQRDY